MGVLCLGNREIPAVFKAALNVSNFFIRFYFHIKNGDALGGRCACGSRKNDFGRSQPHQEIIIVSKNGTASVGVSSEIAGFASHAAVSRTHTQKRREQTERRAPPHKRSSQIKWFSIRVS